MIFVHATPDVMELLRKGVKKGWTRRIEKIARKLLHSK